MGGVPRFAVAAWLPLVVATVHVAAAAQVGPGVAARDQQLAGDVVIVESVVAPEPGWVDIHAEAEVAGNPGVVIGYAHLQPGENNYVLVQVDPARVTPVLYAVLHVDRGQPGAFEFPGADEPVKVDNKSVTAAFHVLNEQTRPSTDPPGLEVRDQALHNGEVVVGRVVAAQAGFVDIHAEAEQAGNPGPVIGYAPIAAGETTYVRVPVPADRLTPVLYAVLHVDEGERGQFEFPGPDAPVQLDGRSVVAPFRLLQSDSPDTVTPAAAASATAVPATATRTQAPTSTTAASATSTSTPTRTAAPTATPTLAPTATQTAAPPATPTTAPTPAASAAPASARGAGVSESPLVTPAAASEIKPESLPATGGGPGTAGLVPLPAIAGISVLFLLSGIALRRSRAREDE